MEKILIVKNGIRTSMMNDVVYGRFDICLFARGCVFGCDYCHSEACSSIIGPSDVIEAQDIIDRFGIELLSESTVVGLGGDFSMQMESWVAFCKKLKELAPKCKIVFFTGMEFDGSKSKYLQYIDAVVWGRSVKNGKIQKTITKSSSDHSFAVKKYEVEIENGQDFN